MPLSTIQDLARKIEFLADKDQSRSEYRNYLPRVGTGFRDYGVPESLRKYGYCGGFRNYADLTGFVITMEDDPENLFYIRQSLEKRELLPIICANGRVRPSQADFITLSATMVGLTDKGDGSTLIVPIASKWGVPPATKAEPLGTDALFDQKVRIARVQEIIRDKHGSWNYIHVAGQIVKRELVRDPETDQSWLRIVLKQHEYDDSNLVVYYTAKDASSAMESCPVGSLVSIAGTYGSRYINEKITPIIWAGSIRACSKGDIYALAMNNRAWMPRWVKELEKK